MVRKKNSVKILLGIINVTPPFPTLSMSETVMVVVDVLGSDPLSRASMISSYIGPWSYLSPYIVNKTPDWESMPNPPALLPPLSKKKFFC